MTTSPTETTWAAVRREYEQTGVEATAIAKRHDVKVRTLRDRAKRQGWRRPAAAPAPASPASGAIYADPLAYLAAVVTGSEPPDAVRVAAARVLLGYTEPKRRLPPPPARSARESERARVHDDEHAQLAEWAATAAAVRRKLQKE